MQQTNLAVFQPSFPETAIVALSLTLPGVVKKIPVISTNNSYKWFEIYRYKLCYIFYNWFL